jgi:hypothetical protein
MQRGIPNCPRESQCEAHETNEDTHVSGPDRQPRSEPPVAQPVDELEVVTPATEAYRIGEYSARHVS